MIVRLVGNLVEKKENALIIENDGLSYEVMVPASVLLRLEQTKDHQGRVHLVIYHYLQISPSLGQPMLIGFLNEIERDFFLQFIKVSGIGPRAAVKALSKPIAEITKAIEAGDLKYLTSLPGIGIQKAKEIVAKLQGKIGKFGLIRDETLPPPLPPAVPNWQEEAKAVLLQLQYRRQEAEELIAQALERSSRIESTEELLNEIYRHKVKTSSGD